MTWKRLVLELLGPSEIIYHHCLHKPDFRSIMTSIPAIRLKSQIVHPQRIKLSSLRFPRCLEGVMPKIIVALSEDLTGRFEMVRSVRAYP